MIEFLCGIALGSAVTAIICRAIETFRWNGNLMHNAQTKIIGDTTQTIWSHLEVWAPNLLDFCTRLGLQQELLERRIEKMDHSVDDILAIVDKIGADAEAAKAATSKSISDLKATVGSLRDQVSAGTGKTDVLKLDQIYDKLTAIDTQVQSIATPSVDVITSTPAPVADPAPADPAADSTPAADVPPADAPVTDAPAPAADATPAATDAPAAADATNAPAAAEA